MRTKVFAVIALAVLILSSNLYGDVWDEFTTTLEAVDALGNRDTVIFNVKVGATSGIDTELGEINLYGTEPQGDLDMRIIQRTDTNNIDLKTDYRYDEFYGDNDIHYPVTFYVIKVFAKNYPVTISLIKQEGAPKDLLDWMQINEENGEYIDGSQRGRHFYSIGELPILLYTFNDSTENNLIWIQQDQEVSIKEEFANDKQLFPNPAKDFVTIEEGNYEEEFSVINLEGNVVKKVKVSEYPYNLNISDLPNGTYFLKNKNNKISNKFIKE
jgi:hypothetical protein